MKKTCRLNNFNPSLSKDPALCKNSAGMLRELLIPLPPPGQMEADGEAIRSTWPWRTASAQLKIPSVCQGGDTKGNSAHGGNSLAFLERLVNWFIQVKSHCVILETTYLTDKQVNTNIFSLEARRWWSSFLDICVNPTKNRECFKVWNNDVVCSQFSTTPTF